MEGGKGSYGFSSGKTASDYPTEWTNRRNGWGGAEEDAVGQLGRMSLLDGMPTQKRQCQAREEENGYRTPEKHRE